MSNTSENSDVEQMGLHERLQLLKAINGVGGGREKAADDEPYAIFTDGEHADREFRRIPRPSYGQRKAVEEIRVKAKIVDEEVKEAICDELGWEAETKADESLSMMEYHKQILPLICREELPEDWDIENVSGYEVQRMLEDFLLGT